MYPSCLVSGLTRRKGATVTLSLIWDHVGNLITFPLSTDERR